MRGVTNLVRAAVLAGLLILGAVGCSAPAPSTGPAAGSSTVGAVVEEPSTISGAELAALWDSPDSEPCENPAPILGDALQAVADSVPDLPNIDTVKARLGAVTAKGPYVEENLQNLHAALLQTQFRMASTADHRGADSPTVELLRANFNSYLDSVIADLESGDRPTPLSDYEFDMADTCD